MNIIMSYITNPLATCHIKLANFSYKKIYKKKYKNIEINLP
jgi:hypothetical protein